MNYDPYAPPQAFSPPPAGPVAPGAPQDWTASEALSIAWGRYKQCAPVLIGAYALMTVTSTVIGQVSNFIHLAVPSLGRGTALAVTGASIVVSWLVTTYFNVGFLRIVLDAARGRPVVFATLFSGGDRFLPAFGCTILVVLACIVGFVLLIVPGIIVALGLSFALFYVVDAEMGPIEAMRASWEGTRGKKGEVFVLGLLGFLIMLAGLAMCCVGIVASAPLYMLSMAVAFTYLSGRMPAQHVPNPQL